MAKEQDWGASDTIATPDWGQNDSLAAQKDLPGDALPDGVEPSKAGAGRGSINPVSVDPNKVMRTVQAPDTSIDLVGDPQGFGSEQISAPMVGKRADGKVTPTFDRTWTETGSDTLQKLKSGIGGVISGAGTIADDPAAALGSLATAAGDLPLTGVPRFASFVKEKITGDPSLPFGIDQGAKRISKEVFGPAYDLYGRNAAKSRMEADANGTTSSDMRKTGDFISKEAQDAMSSSSKNRDKAYGKVSGLGAIDFLANNPGKILDMVSENAPQQLPLITLGFGAGSIARTIASSAGREAIKEIALSPAAQAMRVFGSEAQKAAFNKTSQETVAKAVEAAMQRANPALEAIGISGESSMTLAQTADAIHKGVAEAKYENIKNLPEYQDALAQAGGDPKKAKEYLAARLVAQWAPAAAAGTALGSVITGGAKAEAQALSGQVNKYGAAAKNVLKEGYEEGVQNPMEDAAQYAALSKVDPEQKLDPIKSSIEGAVTSIGQSGATQFAKPVYNSVSSFSSQALSNGDTPPSTPSPSNPPPGVKPREDGWTYNGRTAEWEPPTDGGNPPPGPGSAPVQQPELSDAQLAEIERLSKEPAIPATDPVVAPANPAFTEDQANAALAGIESQAAKDLAAQRDFRPEPAKEPAKPTEPTKAPTTEHEAMQQAADQQLAPLAQKIEAATARGDVGLAQHFQEQLDGQKVSILAPLELNAILNASDSTELLDNATFPTVYQHERVNGRTPGDAAAWAGMAAGFADSAETVGIKPEVAHQAIWLASDFKTLGERKTRLVNFLNRAVANGAIGENQVHGDIPKYLDYVTNKGIEAVDAGLYAPPKTKQATQPAALPEAVPLSGEPTTKPTKQEVASASTAPGLDSGEPIHALSDIRPPKESIADTAASISNSTKVMGNKTVPIDSLVGGVGNEVGDNTRVKSLAGKLKQPGSYFERLIVDDAGNVIEGQHRLDALRLLGVKDVPVVVIQDFERGFPTAKVKNAIASAQKMSPDHATKLASHLAEIYSDEKGNISEVRKYQEPKGFEAAWTAGIDALEKSQRDGVTTSGKPIAQPVAESQALPLEGSDGGIAPTQVGNGPIQSQPQGSTNAQAEKAIAQEPGQQAPKLSTAKPTASSSVPAANIALDRKTLIATPVPQREGAQRTELEAPVVEVPVSKLKLSSDIPQFKEGADAKGITQRLEGSYSRALAAPVQVWQRNDGSMEVISGRHRLDLAQRSGENTIPAQVHREADGFNQDQARMLDIELNVKDGRGKVKDYVKYFQEFGLSNEQAKAAGLLNTAVGRSAHAISNDGSQSLVAAHQNNAISDEAAVAIAQNAPGNEALQNLGMKHVQDGKSINFAVNVMRAARAAGFEGKADSGDLFGFDESYAKEAEAVSREATKQQYLARQQLRAVSGATAQPELARQGGVNVVNQKKTEARIAELKQKINDLEGFATNPEVYKQLRIDAGLAGESKPVEVGNAREQEWLTAPTRADVLAQQAALEAEAKRKEQGGDKPIERKVTGDQVDLFNTQGSVFDAPAPVAKEGTAAKAQPAAESKPNQPDGAFEDFAKKARAGEIYPDSGLSKESIQSEIDRLLSMKQKVLDTGKWSHIGGGHTKASAIEYVDRTVETLKSYLADPSKDGNLKHAYEAFKAADAKPAAESKPASESKSTGAKYGDAFAVDLGAMFGKVPYRASEPVQVPDGYKVLSSEIIVRTVKVTKQDAKDYDLPATIYAWRVSVVKNEKGGIYSQIEAMTEDYGRTPQGEVVGYFTKLSGHANDAVNRIAPAIQKAAVKAYEAAKSASEPGLLDEPTQSVQPAAQEPAVPKAKDMQAGEAAKEPWQMPSNEVRALAALKARVDRLVETLGASRLVQDQNKFLREIKKIQVAISEGGTLGASIAFKDAARDYITKAKETGEAAKAPEGVAKIGGYLVTGLGDKALKAHLQSTNEVDRAAAQAEIERRAAQESARADKLAKIEDSGAVLEGARKLYAKNYADKVNEGMGMDTAAVPLSKSWPEPDYQRLLDEGADPQAVAMAHAMRDEIPTKPSSSWKVKGWVQKVEQLREFASKMLAGAYTFQNVREKAIAQNMGEWLNKVDLYHAVGHARSLKGMTFSVGEYSMYGGQTFNPAKKLWSINVPNANGASWSNGNWGTDLVVEDTKEQAIEKFKAWYATQDEAAPTKTKATSFDIYSYRSKPNVVIVGKRISSRKSIDLKEFATTKEARAYITENKAELERLLAEAKIEPNERREENSPRVGADHRNGADVTSEQFRDTFGFRGEQFGASMPQGERQSNMNQAYDALMDLAGVIGVPPKALSLNGELGLAFGSRGTGGVHPAAAHYERDTTGQVTPNRVVINLTRKNGAGSLAHEFFHAVDNYFARMRGEKGGMLTEQPYARGDGVRPEMVAAFKHLMAAIQMSGIKERAKQLDKKRVKDYWSTGLEMAARSFESYVIAKLQDQNASNDYLANIVPESLYAIQSNYPYPIMGEMPAIRAAFDDFFKTVQTKETANGVAMFSRSGEDGKSSVLSKDGKFQGWPKYNSWTRAEYNDVVSLLPEAYRNDPHRREPLPTKDWDALTATALPELEALNQTVGEGTFRLDSLGNIIADARKNDAAIFIDEAIKIADKNGLGIYITGLGTESIQRLRNLGFDSEFGLAPIVQREARIATPDKNHLNESKKTNAWAQPPRPMASGTINNPAYGTIMSRNPRGFAMPLFSRANFYYSALSREIDSLSTKAQPGIAWAMNIHGMVKNGKVKADEVEWSGITDWLKLQTGKVTKEQVKAYLDANGVQVEETVLGRNNREIQDASNKLYAWAKAEEDGGHSTRFTEAVLEGSSVEELKRIADGNPYVPPDAVELLHGFASLDTPTKYSQYTLPGGKNYREVLLTLPQPDKTAADSAFRAYQKELLQKYGEDAVILRDATPQEINHLNELGAPLRNDGAFKSPHWDQPNVLAHVRVDDRIDADGNKVLMVQEIQSDWGQQGKKEGFVSNAQAPTKDELIADGWDVQNDVKDPSKPSDDPENQGFKTRRYLTGMTGPFRKTEAEAWIALAEQEKNKSVAGMILDAPFVDKTEKWLNLALKRIITMAVDGGYAKVAFTDAETHFKRWGTERIDWAKQPDGSFLVKAKSQEGGEAAGLDLEAEAIARGLSKRNSDIVKSVEELESVIAPVLTEGQDAKDLAPKIWRRMQTENVGTAMPRREGFEAFYGDKNGMNPKTGAPSFLLNSLKALLKKLGGGQMEKIVMDRGGMRPHPDGFDVEVDDEVQPGFQITQVMREKASGGLPLFSQRDGIDNTGKLPYPISKDQSAVERLNRNLANQFKDQTWGSAYVQRNLPDSLNAFAQAARAAFGMQVIGITATEQRFNQFNGVNLYRIAYVNLGAKTSFINIAGHEIYHSLKKDRPDLHQWFAEQARKFYSNFDGYQTKLNAVVAQNEKPFTREAAESELLADFTGDALANPKFLAQLAQADSGKFHRLLNAVVGWLKLVGEKLTGKDLGSSAYFTDVNELRKFLSRALIAYASNKPIERILALDAPTMSTNVSGNQGGLSADDTAPESGGIRFSRSLSNRAVNAVVSDLSDRFSHAGTLSYWHKTVGTMYGLAQKNPFFKRTFDAVQNFINDTSFYATEAANEAKTLLPQLQSWKDIFQAAIKPMDNMALSKPVFEGTLIWGRDEFGKIIKMDDLERQAADLTSEQKAQVLFKAGIVTEGQLKRWKASPLDIYDGAVRNRYAANFLKEGVVFTDAELRSQFNLTPEQIKLYREFRAATDKSLTNLAISDMLKFGGKDVADIRDTVLAETDVSKAGDMLSQYLRSLADLDPNRQAVLFDTADKMIEKADRAADLMKRGYAPLSRFGHYTLDVVDANGNRLYFGMFESKGESNKMAIKMRENYPDATIHQGTVSEEDYKLFAGVSPETLELFGNMLGLESTGDAAKDKAFQEYLKNTKSQRSAMKRLIQRKGIAGFSEDTTRVLAEFVYSNARQTASNLHSGEIKKSVADIPQGMGEVKDQAAKLMNYVQNPQEEAQAIRGLLFAQYIGGSVASAMVNLTQPFTMTIPWLSQYGGIKNATAQLLRATKDALKNTTGDAGMDKALALAEELGIVSPQEVHQLQQQAAGRGALQSGDGTKLGNAKAMANNSLARVTLAWGKLFGVAEQFNRRSTFIAAYRIAIERKMADPMAFAKDAVDATQGIYCVDDQTECLTAAGWKYHAQLATGEMVYSVDESGSLVEAPLIDVHRFTGNISATEFKNQNGFSMVLTDDHTCLVQNYNNKKKGYDRIMRVKAKDVKIGHHFLRVPYGDATGRTAIYSDDEVALFAWVAAEGHLFAHRGCIEKRGVGLVQSQSHNPQHVAEIDALLDRLGGHYNRKVSRADKMVCWQLRKPLWFKIHEALPGKLISFDLVNKLTIEQMALFLDVFVKGDGHTPEEGGPIISQKDIGNLDALQAMAVLSGKSSTIYHRMGKHDFGVLAIAKNSKRAYRKEMTTEHVTLDMAWCPETEHGTWIARRNGRTFITGNSKGNKPVWARGAVGGVLFVFKQFSINYIEMLDRMARSGPEGKKAALYAMGVMILSAGVGGLPGADDLDDIISGFMQALGYNFDSKTARRALLLNHLTSGMARFVEHGISGFPGMPFDVSGRLGLSNLIPGTGLLTKKANHTSDVAELAGPAGDLAKRVFDAAGKVISGDVVDAALAVSPTAIRNVKQAADMYRLGYYKDSRGSKVVDTDPVDAVSKAIGFNPNVVKTMQDATGEGQRMNALNQLREQEIASKWAQGIFEHDPGKAQEARNELTKWNRDNPDMRISINYTQLMSRVKKMRMSKDERIMKTTPKEIRRTVREELSGARQ